jgi:hypothetical protein
MYRLINKMPFLVAIPKRVINPIIDGILITFDENFIAKIPPIRASGRLSRIIEASVVSRNS